MSLTVQKRSPKRSRVMLNAMLEVGDAVIDARIRDVSVAGALVEITAPPAVGTALHLRYGELHVAGRLAWSDDVWSGIEFDAPLPPAALKGFLVRLAVSAPRQHRPGSLAEPEEGLVVNGPVIELRKRAG